MLRSTYHRDTPHEHKCADDDEWKLDARPFEDAPVQSSNGEFDENDDAGVGHLGREEPNGKVSLDIRAKRLDMPTQPSRYPYPKSGLENDKIKTQVLNQHTP